MLKKLISILVLAALVFLSAEASRRLAGARHRVSTEVPVSYSAEVPPALTFVTLGLGGFRGILSEVLWFRAARLQEQGRYLELVQLSRWITLLDPRTAENWVYNAWNLAYNISVMMNRPEDRLRWVKNGISLLRDEGLRFNPREARLYRELSWFYLNKIGGTLDSAYRVYQFDLAREMAPLLNSNGTYRAEAAQTNALAALRLEPSRMEALEKRFGPLDWRLANTHALYWAVKGLPYAEGPEKLLCRQAIAMPLIRTCFEGRFTGSLAENRWRTEERPDLAGVIADYLIDFSRREPSLRQTQVTVRFLIEAIRMTSRHHDDAAAHRLYDRMRSLWPKAKTPPPTFDAVILGKDKE